MYNVNSPIDSTTAIKTVVVLGILAVVVIPLLFTGTYFIYGFSIFILSTIIITYINIPRKIYVTETDIILCNMGFRRIIKRNTVLNIRLVTKKDTAGLWRKFASEGIFGYCGIYASSSHKTLYIYASQSKNWILIQTNRKKYIISPENTDIICIIKPIEATEL